MTKWTDKHLDAEEEFLSESRRDLKKERKLVKKKDRSKDKKTDQQKNLTSSFDSHRGRIIAIFPECVHVSSDDKTLICNLRGSLKQEKTIQKNLIAVGDFVLFDDHNQIFKVEQRYSVLSRADNLRRRQEQILVANVDQVIITASVYEPPLKPSLIDRYIIAAKRGNMRPILVINKIDLLKEKQDKSFVKEVIDVYKSLEIPVVKLCAITGKGLSNLKKLMYQNTSVFSGQSGVGKTSLINKILNLELRVGKVVEKTKKGAHTTTRTTLIPLGHEGFCVDTPGIKSFGLLNLSQDEIKSYFCDLQSFSHLCKFPNCTHMHEPDCRVIQAVENQEISLLRYESYKTLWGEYGENQEDPRARNSRLKR